MPSKVSRYTVAGWVEVADWEALDARLDVIEAGIAAQPPAFVGKRPGTATDAWHSRIDGSTVGLSGFAVRTGLAFVQLDKPTTFGVYQSTVAGGATSNLLANFDHPSSQINNTRIGQHPVHGAYAGVWRVGADGGGDYGLLMHPTETIMNAPNGGNLRLRRNNTDLMTIGTDNILSNVGVIRATGNTDIGSNSIYFASYGGGWYMNDSSWIRSTNAKNCWLAGGWFGTDGGITLGRGGAIDGNYRCDVAGNIRCDLSLYAGDHVFASKQVRGTWSNYPTNNWNDAIMLAYGTYDAYQQARIAIHSPGAAPQIRVMGVFGEMLMFVNSGASAHVPVQSSYFETVSTITAKRDVRSLRPERDYPTVHLDPYTDTVDAPPDIMSLNVSVFRSKVGQVTIVPTDPSGDYDTVIPDDPDTWRNETRTDFIGQMSQREKLGLIAEEVQHVIPSAVGYGPEGEPMGISYDQITVALLDHVQRLTEEVATLRYRIAELENE